MKYRTVTFTALLAGTLDGLAAIISYTLKGGHNPVLIFKYIASGIFGTSAFVGGTEMVMAGVLFHYAIATIWTVLFFVVYPKVAANWRRPYTTAVAYGLIVWLGMNLVVVPLSRTPANEQSFMQILVSMGILIIAIGLPISLMWHKANK